MHTYIRLLHHSFIDLIFAIVVIEVPNKIIAFGTLEPCSINSQYIRVYKNIIIIIIIIYCIQRKNDLSRE